MDIKVIIVTVVALLVCIVGTQWYRNKTIKQALQYMQAQDMEMFTKTIDSFGCKILIPPFNREYMRLNAYFLTGDIEKINEQFDMILNMHINKKQRLDVSVKAFYFYVDENNSVKAKAVLDKMKDVSDETLYEECKLIFDIVLLKKTNYIDVMEEHVEASEENFDCGMFHYLLGLQYSYLKDNKKAIAHLRSAKKDMKGTPYEVKINALLKKL